MIQEVEAFDVSALVRFSGFDIVDEDAIVSARLDEDLSEKLRTVVVLSTSGRARSTLSSSARRNENSPGHRTISNKHRTAASSSG